MANTRNRFSPEVRERAVRMVLEHEKDYRSRWAAVESISEKIGCTAQTLHGWVKRHEVDHGLKAGTSTEDRDRMKALEREVKELRRANEILRKASAFLCRLNQWRGVVTLLRRSSTADS